jgi:hypothetical protein
MDGDRTTRSTGACTMKKSQTGERPSLS